MPVSVLVLNTVSGKQSSSHRLSAVSRAAKTAETTPHQHSLQHAASSERGVEIFQIPGRSEKYQE